MKSKTLSDLKVGESATVEQFCTELLQSYRNRLEELGFSKGRPVVCLQKTAFGGPRLYSVGGAVYSLDKNTTQRIYVE